MRLLLPYALLFYAVLSIILADSNEVNKYDPVIVDKDNNNVLKFYGTISESDEEVFVKPKIYAHDEDINGFICGYNIYTKKGEKIDRDFRKGNSFPFDFSIIRDFKLGLIKLRRLKEIKLSKIQYAFQIAAEDCGRPPRESKKVPIVVRVIEKQQSKKHTPPLDAIPPKDFSTPVSSVTSSPVSTEHIVWTLPRYMTDISPGRIYDRILTVAVENPKKSLVCDYHVTSPVNTPFAIDKLGNIRNTKPLKSGLSYKLTVVAEACGSGSLSSTPVIVDIKVNDECKPSWTGVDSKVDYHSEKAGAIVQLFPTVALQTCEIMCSLPSITANVSLRVDHVQGQKSYEDCSRKSISQFADRFTNCGGIGKYFNLLPQDLTSTSGKSVKNNVDIFSFDGVGTSAVVPATKFNHSLGEEFTVSFWLKHKDSKKNIKEQLLCNSDGEVMNRHHYSVFVHNCHLVFLLRKETEDIDKTKIQAPAEFRFKADGLCDGKWHHYALAVHFPKVDLFEDGKRLVKSYDDYDVLDDFPLHFKPEIHFNRLMIGACWQGKDKKIVQHYRGEIGALAIITGPSSFKSAGINGENRLWNCIDNCNGENLNYQMSNNADPFQIARFNDDKTQLAITGRNVKDVMSEVTDIGYVNFDSKPVPGLRPVSISMSVVCDHEENLRIPPLLMNINVLPRPEPIHVILSNIVDEVAKSQGLREGFTDKEFDRGVEFLPNIQVQTIDPSKYEKSILMNAFGNSLLKGKIFSSAVKDKKCLLPQKVGVCRASMPSWWYNFASKKCEKFIYGGCAGNGNRFPTKSQCENACVQEPDVKVNYEPQLDQCVINVNQDMKLKDERLSYPYAVLKAFKLSTEEKPQGLVISGNASAMLYETVLRQVKYVNHKAPEPVKVPYALKDFTVYCIAEQGKSISNKIHVKVQLAAAEKLTLVGESDESSSVTSEDVKQSKEKDAKPEILIKDVVDDNKIAYHYDVHQPKLNSKGTKLALENKVDNFKSTSPISAGYVVIIVGSVSFVILIAMVALFRAKCGRKENDFRDDLSEMDYAYHDDHFLTNEGNSLEWDESDCGASSMTSSFAGPTVRITENPFDHQMASVTDSLARIHDQQRHQAAACSIRLDGNVDSCDSCSEDEELMNDYVHTERSCKSAGKDLEWDESAIC